jgi:hypothetical protein
MKRLGKIVVWLACGLVLNAGARAADVVSTDNPYGPIVVRNVFGLNPPQLDTSAQQGDPPPKITPNGIMSIFGQLQVLFKVACPAKSGQPARDDSYILSEGQRQDEIEVIQIDEKNSLVTFNNHGTVQELPLAKASASAVNTPMPTQGRPLPNQIPSRFGSRSAGSPGAAVVRNHSLGNGSSMTTVPTSGGMSGQATTGNGSPMTTVPMSGGFSGQATTPQSQAPMTPEEQAIMIEANRLLTQKQVDEGTYPPLPPTALTPPDATAHDGAPLIAK